jgi:hypothetical protein
MEEFIDRIMYIAFFGALPGIFARPKNTQRQKELAAPPDERLLRTRIDWPLKTPS